MKRNLGIYTRMTLQLNANTVYIPNSLVEYKLN